MDSKMEKTASEILFESARYLENEGKWGKNAFFRLAPTEESGGACAMCAHGAIAFCGSSAIKEVIGNRDVNKAAIMMVGQRPSKSQLQIARNCAFEVGLDYHFNDKEAKTKEDVINKLREAAALALKRETSLQ